MKKFNNNKAQTAVELAVFGAVLIFVIGTTIRSTISRAQQQNAMLRAMRMAMTLSYLTTEQDEIVGRNSASVMLVEDRLSVGSSKYGTLDRIPLILQGSGTHSRHMLMPVDFGDSEDLPLFDMFVNGKHFVFSTSGFKYVNVARSCSGLSPCPADCTDGCVAGAFQYARGVAEAPVGGIPVIGIPEGDDYWEPHCFENQIITRQYLSCEDPDGSEPFDCPDAGCPPEECPGPACIDCSDTTTQVYERLLVVRQVSGCPKMYTIIDNHPLVTQWCDTAPCLEVACSSLPEPAGGCNLSVDERFDMDRNDLDGIPGDVVVPVAQREGFSWQWFLVAPVQEEKFTTLNYSASALSGVPSATTLSESGVLLHMGEGITLPGGDVQSKNIHLDVDYDLKLEYIMPNIKANGVMPNEADSNGVITRIGIMDPQEGDLDMTYNDNDKARGILPFGFTQDMTLYAFVRGEEPGGGTYFQIDEGKLFSADTKQYIRNVSRKDQVDLIERIFRLSNNTGGYCYQVTPGSGSYIRRDDASYRAFYAILDASTQNPVEVCVSSAIECFSGANLNRTCMAGDEKLIFIRSRIQDLRGHQWVTDLSEDPYINFER